MVLDALSFLWSASWIAAIRKRVPKPPPKPDRHLGREIAEGVRFVVGNRLLRAIAMCTGSANLFSLIGAAVYMVLLARILGLSPGAIGLLTATMAIGGLLGSLCAAAFARALGQGPAIWVSAALMAPAAFVTPFAQRDWTLGLLAAAQLFMWGMVVIYNITQVSFRQALTPPELLGRMNATMRFLVWGTMPIGALLGGILGTWIGVRETLLVAAIGGALSWLPVYFSPLRG